MYSDSLKLKPSMNYPIRTITDSFSDKICHPNWKIGTKYMFFNKEQHLIPGATVYASKFAGRIQGKITDIDSKNGICYINGEATFISDIQYILLTN